MINIFFAPLFLRELKKVSKIDKELREEIFEKIELFKRRENHQKLRVHKLHGEFSEFSSFSINYRYRIVFEWLSGEKALLHDIGDHEIYK